ncbi:MAG: hypothetical protein B5M53_01435 [Candidatus Cloacimonas sp. 4484_209]|nr:MAG: hypothetical protein B5M53_01435 [Candidatus Cloacimonas sp. 4484_209]
MIDISIIIVTYNSGEDIENCLNSVLNEKSPTYEIIVIDNASTDNTKEVLKKYEKVLTVVYATYNLGYSRANNIGFRYAKGKYIFLLNPDATLNPGSLKKMFDIIEKNNDVIAVAPLLLNLDGTVQSSIRSFPDYRVLFFELTGLSRIFPASRFFNRWRLPGFRYDKIQDVEQPMASAILLRRSFFKKDFMDESFTMFFNDVDLCYRIKSGGGRILFFPYASVMHIRGKSTGKEREKMIPLHTKGFIRYFVKHRKTLKDKILFLLFLPWLILNTILRIVLLRFFALDF